jgi:hypothetical protein
MAGQVIEKRKFEWKIKNFTKTRYDEYAGYTAVDSDQFEVILGNKKTKW